eukprot:TRINITY_DN3106_c0_g1_i2.p1 TRINITY_DN3106_c0_g1~~TRINITY_DN3106_c0_g1_i2.p1  ORF type:complete len:341 (+),score=88.08 TRINITY_DN3106_c0_g1_i2:83-1024(+)
MEEELCSDLNINLFVLLSHELVEDLDLVCMICLNLLNDPVTILSDIDGMTCQHSFCGECLKRWQKQSSKCPNCRAQIRTVIGDLRVKRFLANQLVKCPLAETEGCEAIGKLGMKGRDHGNWIDEHTKECPHRIVTCGCHEKMKRKEIAEHQESVCPVYGKKDCPFKVFGCTERLNKADLEKHIANGDRQHLLLSMAFMQKSVKIDEAEEVNLEVDLKVIQESLIKATQPVVPPSKEVGKKFDPVMVHYNDEKSFSPVDGRRRVEIQSSVAPEFARELRIGESLDVQDLMDGMWYESTILDLNEQLFLIRYTHR